jgi:hypothetical protein
VTELYPTLEDERPDLQAALFYARERRRSFVGVSKLHRTHRFAGAPASGSMAVPAIDVASAFPASSRGRIVTFHTQVTTTASKPTGLVFELGSDAAGVGVAVFTTRIAAVAGGANPNRSISIWDNVAIFDAGRVMDITLAVRPGDAEMRLWVDGQLHTAYNPASSGTMGPEWASSEAGSLASAANGTVPSELSTANNAPAGFEVTKPLSVYLGALPQEF